MRIIFGLLGGFLSAALLITAAIWYADNNFPAVPETTFFLASPSAVPTPVPPRAASRISPKTVDAPSVVCEGCEKEPQVEAEPRRPTAPAEKDVTATKNVKGVFDYTPKEYVVSQGKAVSTDKLAYAILLEQDVGHIFYKTNIPVVSYNLLGEKVRPGLFELDPSGVTLARDISIPVDFSIRYPALSEEQFRFIRAKKDYRLIYGLIEGIVEHEEEHFRILKGHITELENVITKPLTEKLTIEASSVDEFYTKVNEEVIRSVKQKIKRIQQEHMDRQAAHDAPEVTITFTFENEVDGEVPPPLEAKFKGKVDFNFQLPSGNIPRPPKPNISI